MVNRLYLSLAALALWGIWGFLSKAAGRHLPAPAVYVLSIAGNLPVIAYLGWTGALAIPGQAAGVATALAGGICMAVGTICFFQALAQAPASVVVPLTGLYPVVTVVLSWAVLHEALSLRHLAGIALALAAVWLLSD